MVSEGKLRRQIERDAARGAQNRFNYVRLVVVLLAVVALVVGVPLAVSALLSKQQTPPPAAPTAPVVVSSSSTPTTPTSATTPTQTEAVVPTGAISDGSDVGEDHGHKVTGPVPTQPAWSKAEAAKAKDTATKAAEAFTDTGKPAAAWFKALSPYLNSDARQDYATTDPLNVPFLSVLSVGEPVQNAKYREFVTVPVKADGGTFSVELIYSADFKRFEVTQFVFKDQG